MATHGYLFTPLTDQLKRHLEQFSTKGSLE